MDIKLDLLYVPKQKLCYEAGLLYYELFRDTPLKFLDKDNNELPFKDYTSIKTIQYPDIKKVIYNPPHTIIQWKDHTETRACLEQKDGEYSKEYGFMVCILKKLQGTKEFRKLLETYCWSDNDKIIDKTK